LGRFYRLVSRKDPLPDDFRSQAARGRVYADPEVQRRAEEVSVWDSLERAMHLARKKPQLGYIAILQIPEDVQLRPGKRGHWGIPRSIPVEEIMRWIADVVPVPSREEYSR
jgi:hypothetical protein